MKQEENMKYEIEYELEGVTQVGAFYAPSSGEAFAKCLINNKGCTLKRCRKIGLNLKGDSDPAFGITEWEPTPVQRQPVEAPAAPPARRIPKYKETPSPMPSMRSWAIKHGLIPAE